MLLVPVAFAIERLIKRDGLRIADGVLAAVLAHGVTLATDLWVAKAAPGSIQDALTQPAARRLRLTDPVHGYLAPVIAYMTAVGMARRPRWRVVLWVRAAARRLRDAGRRLHDAVLDHPDRADRLDRRLRHALRGRLAERPPHRPDT